MWGVVPRALWADLTPPAEDNTIQLALRPFLARKGERCVLIEGGVGARWDEKWRGIYGMRQPTTLADSLRRVGVAPEEVTDVVASHCHWDHIGAQVVTSGRRRARAAVSPHARHFAPARRDRERAQRPGHASAARPIAPEDVEPSSTSGGLLEAYDRTDRSSSRGSRAHVLGGHSDGVSVITLGEDAGGDDGDLLERRRADDAPHPAALHHGLRHRRRALLRAVRSEWLAKRVRTRGWIGLFYHDAERGLRTHRARRQVVTAFEPVVAETGSSSPCAWSRSARASPSWSSTSTARDADLVGVTTYCIHPAQAASAGGGEGRRDEDPRRRRGSSSWRPTWCCSTRRRTAVEDAAGPGRGPGCSCLSSLPKDGRGRPQTMVREIGDGDSSHLARSRARSPLDIEARADARRAGAGGPVSPR